MRSSLKREVCGSILRLIKLGLVLPMARHRCDSSSKESVFSKLNDAEMAPLTRYMFRDITASVMKDLIWTSAE